MDLIKTLEVFGIVGMTMLGAYIKDVVSKATARQRIAMLEIAFKELRGELSKLDETLGQTNQSLAAINATVKGLAKWIERTEDRLNNL